MSRHLPPGSPEFSRLFETFEHTAYRLETLQEYREPSEAAALAAFLEGREPEMYPGKRAWAEFVAAAGLAGKVMQRVHVVTEPLSDYLRYEIGWSYVANVTFGEDVRIWPVTASPDGLPGDYWLFDSRTLARMHYDTTGKMTSVEMVTDPAAIVEACYWRDAALHAGTPWEEYEAARVSELRAS